MVGIELECADFRRRVTSPALSVTEWVHSSALATSLQAPLRSRTVGFPESGSDLGSTTHRAFPSAVELKCSVHIRPPIHWFAMRARSCCEDGLSSALCPRTTLERPSAQSPFAQRRFRNVGEMSLHLLERRYPFFIARTGSCAEPIPFPSLWSNLVPVIFAGCYRPLLAIGPSRRYLCESFLRCLGPYHDGLQVALTCYFPCSIGLPQKSYRSAYREIPLKRLHSGVNFRGCSHFVMFRPLGLLATLVAPTTAFLQGGL